MTMIVETLPRRTFARRLAEVLVRSGLVGTSRAETVAALRRFAPMPAIRRFAPAGRPVGCAGAAAPFADPLI